jgi:hypothetical protein
MNFCLNNNLDNEINDSTNEYIDYINENSDKMIKIVTKETIKKQKNNEGVEYVYLHEIEEKFLDTNDKYITLPEINLNYDSNTGSYCMHPTNKIENENYPNYNFRKYKQSIDNNIFETIQYVAIYTSDSQLISSQVIRETFHNPNFNSLSKESFYQKK